MQRIRSSLLVVSMTAFLTAISASADPGDPLAKILASDGDPGDYFGTSITVYRDTAIIGARYDDDNGSDAGSAYIFDISDPFNPVEVAKLLPDDGTVDEWFGWSLATNGQVVMVGTPRDSDTPNGNNAGSAYVFDANTGAQIGKILASDGGGGDQFGYSVSIHEDTAIIGAPFHGFYGGAYVYDISDPHKPNQIAKLLPHDTRWGDVFGISVDVNHHVVIVGSPGPSNAEDSGSAYLYQRTTGDFITRLYPADKENRDWFGFSVALSSATAIIGAPLDEYDNLQSGSAFLFDLASGEQIAQLLPNDPEEKAEFGSSVAINDFVAIVGAHSADRIGANSGAAYLFDAITGAPITEILPADGAENDGFSWAVALNQTTAIVGARGDDPGGSAYLFDADLPTCLRLNVENLVAGKTAIFTLTDGTPGQRAATLYGFGTGQTTIKNYAGFCATFGIKNINQRNVIGGMNRIFDTNGETAFTIRFPPFSSGLPILFQTAEQGTCPDECTSNLIKTVIR